MRLFVALDIPPGLAGRLRTVRQTLRGAPALRTATSVHLTLKFLGEVPEEKVHKVVAALKEVPFAGCRLQTTTLGMFAHVLWLGVKLHKELAQLQQRVARAVRPFTTHDPRPYTPHLTLARFQRLEEKERETVDALLKERLEETWKAEAFVLYRSTLTPRGPVYEVVATFGVNNNMENK